MQHENCIRSPASFKPMPVMTMIQYYMKINTLITLTSFIFCFIIVILPLIFCRIWNRKQGQKVSEKSDDTIQYTPSTNNGTSCKGKLFWKTVQLIFDIIIQRMIQTNMTEIINRYGLIL